MKIEICKNLEALLLEMFDADKELLNKWHIESPCDLDTAVDRTLKDFKQCENLTIYVLKNEDEKVSGWFGHEKYDNHNYLTGFGIKPEFRLQHIKDEFMYYVDEVLGELYYIGLYEKNIPARKFIQKNGGLTISLNKDKFERLITFYKIQSDASYSKYSRSNNATTNSIGGISNVSRFSGT